MRRSILSGMGMPRSFGRACSVVLVPAVACMAAPTAWAQCEPGWEVGITDGLPDFDDAVTATLNWDPDGAGPEPEMIVFGGEFLNAGNLGNVNHIVGWDGTRWVRFGAGLPFTVWAIGTSNGRLVASYAGYDNGSADGVSMWDGAQWVEMSDGLESGTVGKFVEFDDVLYAAPLNWGMTFELANDVHASMARWDGATWLAFAASPAWNVADMAVWNGKLVIAGSLYGWVDGQYKPVGVLEWNDPWWLALGTNTPKVATTLGQYGGDLLVGSAGVSPNSVVGSVQRWDGQAWSALGGGIGNNVDVSSFTVWNGGVVAAGRAWDGAAWNLVPPTTLGGPGKYAALGGALIAAGALSWFPETYRHAAILKGDRWFGLGGGPIGINPNTGDPSRVRSMCVHNGRVLVAGTFREAGGEPAVAIAEWRPMGWSAWGEPLEELSGIEKLTVLDGEVLAQGTIVRADGESVGPIARWDGARWRRLGDRYPWGAVTAIYDGNLYAYCDLDGEGYRLVRWTGAAWEEVWAGRVESISALASFGGNLVALGYFGSVDDLEAQNAALWDGQSWHAMGAELLGPARTALVHDGTLFAAGSRIIANWTGDVARWDGAAWQNASEGIVGDVAVLSEWNGAMVAGTSTGIFRWNGASWHRLAEITHDPFTTQREVNSMKGLGDTLLVGGAFWTWGDKLSPHFARWREPVPPAIDAGPLDAVACPGGAMEFAVSTSGSGPIAYQWRRDGAPLVDGTTAGGAMISGAQSAVLSIAGLSHADAGLYDCLASNQCGQAASAPALLAVCTAELDCDGFVNGQDFDLFVELFSAADIGADVDGDGFVTGEDFDRFVAAFEAGC